MIGVPAVTAAGKLVHHETAPARRAGVAQHEPLAPEYEPCANLLRKIIDDQRAQNAADGGEAAELPFDPPFVLGSSSWVGNRLCEVLPVPLKAKQKLMELGDARTRLDILMQYLRQHKIVA